MRFIALLSETAIRQQVGGPEVLCEPVRHITRATRAFDVTLQSEDTMLVVPIRDTSRPGSRVVTEPIPDVGQAVLDRITALPRSWPIGGHQVTELRPDRHAEVG